MNRLTLTPTLALFILPAIGFCQENTSFETISDAKNYCELVVAAFEKEDVISGCSLLRDIWNIDEQEMDLLESKTVKHFSLINGRFGDVIGHQLIKEELVDGVAVRLTYVVKYDIHLLRYTFIFYQGKNDGWMLSNFKWDDSIGGLFGD